MNMLEQYDTDDNRNRLALLARKYGKNPLSREEDARLAILTDTLRRLIPRVTTEDFQKLKAIASRVKEIKQEKLYEPGSKERECKS